LLKKPAPILGAGFSYYDALFAKAIGVK